MNYFFTVNVWHVSIIIAFIYYNEMIIRSISFAILHFNEIITRLDWLKCLLYFHLNNYQTLLLLYQKQLFAKNNGQFKRSCFKKKNHSIKLFWYSPIIFASIKSSHLSSRWYHWRVFANILNSAMIRVFQTSNVD